MPELPEVENLRLILSPILVGQTFTKIEMRRRDLRFPFPKNLEQRLTARTILQISRRAKYLLFHLDSSEILIVHLGMTGRLLLSSTAKISAKQKPRQAIGSYNLEIGHYPQHDHLIFYTKDGIQITYNDSRRFGYLSLVKEETLQRHSFFKDLGVEPLSEEFTNSYLARRASGRRTHLKSFLMDQRHIAGLGNIYVCEALFRAGLSPKRRAETIVGRNLALKNIAQDLVSAIRGVIKEAVEAGGSTLKDFLKPDGSKGSYQNNHKVYDRDKKPCARSGCCGIILRITQNGRSTFYCPQCQQ